MRRNASRHVWGNHGASGPLTERSHREANVERSACCRPHDADDLAPLFRIGPGTQEVYAEPHTADVNVEMPIVDVRVDANVGFWD